MILSIIVPVYNKEDKLISLFDCISSVKNLLIELEVIFINDGSSDRSEELIKQFIQNTSIFNLKLKYFSQNNKGVSNTRNRGIQLAKGKYIWFVDADDEIIINNIISLICDSLFEYDLYIFSHSQYNIKNDQLISINVSDFNDKKNLVKRLFEEQSFIPIWNKIYKRSFLIENNIEFDAGVNYAEDLLFNLKVFSKSNFLDVRNVLGYKYNIDALGLSSNKINDLVLLIEKCIVNYDILKVNQHYNLDFIYDGLIKDTFFKVISNNFDSVNKIENSYLDIKRVYDAILEKKVLNFLGFKSIFLISLYKFKFLKIFISLIYFFIYIKNFIK